MAAPDGKIKIIADPSLVIDNSDHSAGKNPYYKPGRDAAEPYPEHGGSLIED